GPPPRPGAPPRGAVPPPPARAPPPPRGGPRPGPEPSLLPALGRPVQRLEGARLCDGVHAPEQQLGFAVDRVTDVLELEPIRAHGLELDPLHLAPAPHLAHRHFAVPGVVEEERPLAADHLALVAL